MSHEGIQFVSGDKAAQPEAQPALPREATDPQHVRVDKTKGTGMEIDWRDGHHSQWSFPWLRLACPCATCHEEREATGRAIGQPKAQPAQILPMFQAPPAPTTVTPVGRYAIRFDWNDGHASGIYSWEYLRRQCQCADCVAARAQPSGNAG
jgi:DUF971 family protein